MKKICLVIIIVFTFSCEGEEDKYPNCAAVLCPANQLFLTYRNTAGDTLIGSTYTQDSFKLSSPTDVIYIKPVPGNTEILAIFYQQLESDVDYSLELNETNVDILNFNFSTATLNCCVNSSMSELIYNNTSIPAESEDFYILIKE